MKQGVRCLGGNLALVLWVKFSAHILHLLFLILVIFCDDLLVTDPSLPLAFLCLADRECNSSTFYYLAILSLSSEYILGECN